MKNKIYTMAVLLLVSVLMKAQTAIPNSGFENWDSTNVAFVPTPTGWTTNAASIFPQLLQQSPDAHSGNFSAKIGVQKFNTTLLSGILTCRFKMTSGNPTTATAWVKPSLAGNDSFFINVITSSFNGTSLTLIRGGNKTIYPSDNSNVWTAVTVQMSAVGTGMPDTAYVGLGYWSGKDTTSYILVDDIELGNSGTTGIGDVRHNQNNIIEKVYPNPASNHQYIVYSINEDADVSMAVHNLLGQNILQVVNERQHPGHYRAELNTADLASGPYYITLKINGETSTEKILVQH
ncbi:MAG TPA: T9SS type A sorting domain-containing protein [Chitinophagales bacterium]|nr:T9SS type A sorting domain-containing protein [Chitinophagales bacterium]